MKKIKILFSIGRLSVGGAEKLLIYKLKFLDKEKFEPYLLTLFPETKDSLAAQLPIDDNHWHQGNFHGTFDIVAFIRLSRLLRKERFGVVVTELFSANLLVRLAALLVRPRPVLVSYEHNLYPDKRRWQIWIDRQLARRTRIIIVDAQSVKTFTARQESISENKFVVLYHPPLIFEPPALDKEILYRKFGISAQARTVLTVSRLVEEKGHRYLIEAVPRVIRVFPHAHFLLVGWGPLMGQLRLLINRLGVQKNVHLTGRLDIKDILPYADVYVEPALWVDLSIALLEAMEKRKPVIATAVGDIPQFIQDGENGFLVQPKDTKMIAERLIQLLSDKELCQRMGEKARVAIQPYTIVNYMRAFERLIMVL